jgi:hypothetical protein
MATVLFALLEWCFVFWYARNLPLFSRTKFSKLAAGATWICVVVGIPLGQLSAYAWLGHQKRLNDPFLMIVICIESLISAGILFRALVENRKRNRGSENAL